MIIYTTTLSLMPDVRDELLPEFEKMCKASEADEGCIAFRVYADLWEPDLLLLYEQYENAEAVRFHRQTPHYQAVMKAIQQQGEGVMTAHERGWYAATPIDQDTLKPSG